MKEIRVTAHFGTRQEVLDACKSLLKKCPNDYNEIRSIGKKVSFITTLSTLPPFTVGRTRLLLEESSHNVLHHLNDCKGLLYSIVVNS
jgi:hypothetical protein